MTAPWVWDDHENTITDAVGISADPAFIVTACNAHDALTARVAELEAALDSVYQSETWYDAQKIARAALKAAK